MEQDFERMNIKRLLDLYMEESRIFSKALESGICWRQLHMLSNRIRRIGNLINFKRKK
ncbi:MAG: hypothetical protein H0U44_07480 [Flavisolibacter sp.]|nr:hypothetical protein [Flavisolibacter sp.]